MGDYFAGEHGPVQDVLAGRNIVIGVCGGIAAFKAASLVTALRKRGAEVKVVMTPNATEFVTPLTFATLTGRPVDTDMWADRTQDAMTHISLQEFADAMLICPATANVIGKVANGIADDLLTTSIMAATYPVGFAPAMNAAMWANPAVVENVATLRRRGYWIVGPEMGRLASGAEGAGRLVGLSALLSCIERMVSGAKPSGTDLSGRKVLITGGPTREHIDPVRYLSNASSGKMALALADQAAAAGADVTLVTGAPAGDEGSANGDFNVVRVVSAAEMAAEVRASLGGVDVFIAAAAVADYTPAAPSQQKLKKTGEAMTLQLEPTQDILRSVAQGPDRPPVVIGFAAESEQLIENAAAKLDSKNLDLIVANNITEPGSGFGTDTNRVTILGRGDHRVDLPLMSKWAVAGAVMDEVARILGEHDAAGTR